MAIGPLVPFEESGTNETVPYLSGSPLKVHLALDLAQAQAVVRAAAGQSQRGEQRRRVPTPLPLHRNPPNSPMMQTQYESADKISPPAREPSAL